MTDSPRTRQPTPFLSRPLGLVTRLAVRFPKATVTVAVLLAVAAIGVTVLKLQLHTDRLDLLNPQSNYNKLWIDYIDQFGDQDDTVVVVEASEAAGRDEVVAAMDHVGAELERHDRLFHDVYWKVDPRSLNAKGLYYLSPEQLVDLEQFLQQLGSVTAGDWSELNLVRMTSQLAQQAQSVDPRVRNAAAATLIRHVENLDAALVDRDAYRSPWESLNSIRSQEVSDKPEYLLADHDRLGLVLLQVSVEGSSFDRGSAAIDRLRQLLARIESQHPTVSIGLTGLPIMENDEMRASQTATLQAAGLSLVGVSCLFVAGFGGVRHPLMTVSALLLSIAWAFGYVTLAIGHLNILSMSFGVILIGLGIDFGIHYVARYLQHRQDIRSSEEALLKTAQGVGPGILTGGVTTAIAFFAAGLTDFTGIAELGVIAGGGVLLCIVGALVVLPALIHLGDRHRVTEIPPRPLSVNRWLAIVHLAPRTATIGSVLLTGLVSLGLGRLWYDHNLLNLQPLGLESVQLEERLLEKTDQSVWFALSVSDSPEELLARKAQFELLPTVERTEQIASRIYVNAAGKRPSIERIGRQLASLPQRPPLIPVDAPEDVARGLALVGHRLGEGLQAQDAAQIQSVVSRLTSLPKEACYACLARYQHQLALDLLTRLQLLRAVSNPEPPQLTDLPPSLVTRFVGQGGQHLLKVYSKTDIWDMQQLKSFVSDIRSVDPRATGKPLQTFEASLHMQESYVHAALYALIGVSMVLVLDFRSIRYSLLALVPVGLGMLQLFGLLGLLGIPLNPANMIVLPLILGIGLDDGVHVIHDFRCSRGQFRLSRSTSTAILLTSLTTMIGFGSMMIADHRGLQSLGRVLTIGVFCCLFTSLVALPGFLAWITRKEASETDLSSPEEPQDIDSSQASDHPPALVSNEEPGGFRHLDGDLTS